MGHGPTSGRAWEFAGRHALVRIWLRRARAVPRPTVRGRLKTRRKMLKKMLEHFHESVDEIF
jgi:hypothetical protein